MALSETQSHVLAGSADDNREVKENPGCSILSVANYGKEDPKLRIFNPNQGHDKQQNSALMVLATRAVKEWEKKVSATDAMAWGAGITNTLKSYKDFVALRSLHGLQRFVVMSAGRPQFKLVHRSITIPKKMASKYQIGAGPIRVRLFIKSRGETWAGSEVDHSFTASWFDLPQKYKISLSKDHDVGQRPGWTFWYKPSQSGSKAKRAAMELLTGLDDLVNANLVATSMDLVVNYSTKRP